MWKASAAGRRSGGVPRNAKISIGRRIVIIIAAPQRWRRPGPLMLVPFIVRLFVSHADARVPLDWSFH